MAKLEHHDRFSKIISLWNQLETYFIPSSAWESDLLTLWREKIAFILFFSAAVLGPFALIPSLILSFAEKLWAVFMIDSAAYALVLVVLFSRKFTLRHKTGITFFIFYALGTALLFILGFYGGGYIWLFGASLIVGAMTGLTGAGIALLFNFASLVSIGVYIAAGSPQWALGTENALEKWMVMTANFMLLNTLITLLVAVMLNSLKIALAREQETAVELKKNREELLAIFSASPDPILVYDNLDHVQYLNDAFSITFGWHLDDVKGKTIPFIPPDRQNNSLERCLNHDLKHQNPAMRFETKRLTKDGRLLDVSLSAAPIQGKKGEIAGVVINLKDITERIKWGIKLQQSQRMESIGTLAAGIAHDFNNILSPIMGHTEMLLMDAPENDPSRENLNQIHVAAIRAKNLVKQILAFSRQESGERSDIKIQPLIKEALKLIRSTIPTTIEIKQDIHPDCGIIKADPTQIHQVIMNLTTNAFHAVEKTGGKIKVSLTQAEFGELDILNPGMTPGLYACLVVSDTGVGMDKTVMDKMFDPFFTTKKKGRGTGMGLSVVHGIVTAMKGAIHVYSEPEKGTQFHVYFPIQKNFNETQDIESEESIQGGSEHILLVDDEKNIIAIVKRMLERLGYQVTSRTSSLEALDLFRSDPDRFDLVITDMAMPHMPGDKLSMELITIRHDIPILLCTGFSEDMPEEKAVSLGIKGFLLKPISMKELARKIRTLLGNGHSSPPKN